MTYTTCLACIGFVSVLAGTAAAFPTDAEVAAAAGAGASWLAGKQNVDGSWGSTEGEKLLYTTTTVRAFRALNLLDQAYLRGITWLENHSTPNSDFAARRIAALLPHGDTVSVEHTALVESKSRAGPGIARSGWGLSEHYHADPLDTAVVLRSLGTNNATFLAGHRDAIDGLRNTISSSTWTIGQPEAALPFRGDLLTTVAVAQAFRACNALDVIPECDDLSFLPSVESLFVNYAYSTALDRALITGYFTALRDIPPISPTAILQMVDELLDVQSSSGSGSGSWDADVFTTATAIHALASWLGLDSSDASEVVSISHAGIRAAVNRSLGHGAMDKVTMGGLRRLTWLDLSYASTGSILTAIADADNVTTIDLSGNPCLLALSEDYLRQLFPKLVTIIKHPVGDVNQDDKVNAYDRRLVLAHLLNRTPLTGVRARAADLTLDGRLDARDLYWLSRTLVNLSVSDLCQG